MSINLEGKLCRLYNILIPLRIIRLDHWEESTPENPFILIIQPRWFWQRPIR